MVVNRKSMRARTPHGGPDVMGTSGGPATVGGPTDAVKGLEAAIGRLSAELAHASPLGKGGPRTTGQGPLVRYEAGKKRKMTKEE